jgi:hypothetical protein
LDRALVLARGGDLISITDDPVIEARDTEFRQKPVTDSVYNKSLIQTEIREFDIIIVL